jgi:hypothetical protein
VLIRFGIEIAQHVIRCGDLRARRGRIEIRAEQRNDRVGFLSRARGDD